MLIIEVELLHGTYRADPEGTAHSGSQVEGEWPPSPARLFAALVAADGTRSRCRHTTGEELLWLESQTAPTIEANGFDDITQSDLHPRFVVKQDETYYRPSAKLRGQVTAVQEYVGRVAVPMRPGVRVCPRRSTVRFVWSERPPEPVLRGLRVRAARIGYLGCADSPVRVSVRWQEAEPDPSSEEPEGPDALGWFAPSEDGRGDVLVGGIEPGTTDRLDAHFDRWLEGGPNVRRAHSPGLRRLVRYTSPGAQSTAAEDQRPAVLWFRLDRPISGRRVLAFAQALRSTLLSRYVEAPPLLHGHGFDGKGHDTARYLALPNVGGRRSDGRIHGAAIWFPPGVEPQVVEACREALTGSVEVRAAYGRSVIRPHGGERRPWAAAPARWTTAGRRWATAFPAVHERSRRGLNLEEVGRWCEHAGLPAPIAFRHNRSPLIAGGIDLAPPEVNRPGRPARRYGHFEIVFASEVHGPVAIGAARQFGLGLMVPVEAGAADG